MLVHDREVNVSGRRVRIAKLDADGYRYLDDPEPIIAALRKGPGRPDLFTFVENVTQAQPRYQYQFEWENFAVIPVTTFDNYFKNQILTVARNRARQAGKKGVELREVQLDDHMVRGIWEIYNETPIRQGRLYPHYGKDLETVRREEATFPDCSAFAGAFLGDELIGFIKVVWDENRVQGALMNILSKICHRDKAPTNALICEAVKICERRGLANLVYGCYAFAGREEDNLTDFKQKTGFKRVEVPRYYVPLTAWGSVALRLGLHHRLVDRLPEGLGKRLRELRAGWYQRRYRAAKAGA
jgi:hypothetical protein